MNETPDASEFLLVISNLPDRDSAETLAAALLQSHAAACVNILSPCKSVYRWQGAVEEAEEVPVFIKTTVACYPAAMQLIERHHPYDVPEIIALPLHGGSPAYLQWLAEQVRAEN
jgi:periplasmic divalent cation tolerance protein